MQRTGISIPLIGQLAALIIKGAVVARPLKRYIFEAGSTEFIFVIGNVGFRSVASLKNYVGNLPPTSTLEWAPGRRRLGGEPLLSSEQEIEEFKTLCAEKNINFVLVPSG